MVFHASRHRYASVDQASARLLPAAKAARAQFSCRYPTGERQRQRLEHQREAPARTNPRCLRLRRSVAAALDAQHVVVDPNLEQEEVHVAASARSSVVYGSFGRPALRARAPRGSGRRRTALSACAHRRHLHARASTAWSAQGRGEYTDSSTVFSHLRRCAMNHARRCCCCVLPETEQSEHRLLFDFLAHCADPGGRSALRWWRFSAAHTRTVLQGVCVLVLGSTLIICIIVGSVGFVAHQSMRPRDTTHVSRSRRHCMHDVRTGTRLDVRLYPEVSLIAHLLAVLHRECRGGGGHIDDRFFVYQRIHLDQVSVGRLENAGVSLGVMSTRRNYQQSRCIGRGLIPRNARNGELRRYADRVCALPSVVATRVAAPGAFNSVRNADRSVVATIALQVEYGLALCERPSKC